MPLSITEFQQQANHPTGAIDTNQGCASRFCYRCNKYQPNTGGNSKKDALGRLRWICNYCTDIWRKRQSKATAERSMQSKSPK